MLTHKHLKKTHRLKIEEHCPIDQKSFRDFKHLISTYTRYRLRSNVEFWIFYEYKDSSKYIKEKDLKFFFQFHLLQKKFTTERKPFSTF